MLAGCAGQTAVVKPQQPGVVVSEKAKTIATPAAEKELLSKIASMKSGDTRFVGDMKVMAGDIYIAASGTRCRQVTISPSTGMKNDALRLACENGTSWFFPENVFVTYSKN